MCACARIQFSSGIIRVSQTWWKSRQECAKKGCVVVGGNVKNLNNGVNVGVKCSFCLIRRQATKTKGKARRSCKHY